MQDPSVNLDAQDTLDVVVRYMSLPGEPTTGAPTVQIHYTDVGTTYTCPASTVASFENTNGQTALRNDEGDYTDQLAGNLMPTICPTTGTAPPTTVNPFPTISLSEFNQIQTGMSYDQVVAIVGSPGTLSVSGNVAGTDNKIYEWSGADGGDASVQFQNGAVIVKAQADLG